VASGFFYSSWEDLYLTA
jgi:hypothetical protein